MILSQNLEPNILNSMRKNRVKVTQACNSCRKRRTKCDGTKTSCSTCVRLNIPCQYELENKKRGPQTVQSSLMKLVKEEHDFNFSFEQPYLGQSSGVLNSPLNPSQIFPFQFSSLEPSHSPSISIGFDLSFTGQYPLSTLELIFIKHFIKFINNDKRFLHEEWLWDRINHKDKFPKKLLLFSIYTVVSCVFKGKHLNGQHFITKDLSAILFKKAKKLLNLDYTNPHVEVIQSLNILSLVQNMMSSLAKGYIYCGMASRLVAITDLKSCKGINLENENKRVAWWSSLSQDVLSSIGLGRPMIFELKYGICQVPKLYLEERRFGNQYYIYYCDLLLIMAKICTKYNSKKGSVLEIENRLLNWYHHLINEYKVICYKTDYNYTILLLNYLYYFAILILYRPYCIEKIAGPINVEMALEKCIYSTNQMIELMELLIIKKEVIGFGFILYCVFQNSLICIEAYHFNNPLIRHWGKSSLMRIQNINYAFSNGFDLGKRAYDNLNELLKARKIDLNGPKLTPNF